MATYEEKPSRDEVLAEAYRIKGDLAREYQHDIHRMFEAARARERASGRKILSPPQRPPAAA